MSMNANINDIALARICHEINRAYCASLGDHSQVPWEQAPAWQQESAVKGVRLHRSDPSAGPAASHNAWMADKIATGWTYGPVKDPAAKTHPCLVPFERLPREQQAKDFIFRAAVHAFGTLDGTARTVLGRTMAYLRDNSWGGGASSGYYCQLCYRYGEPKPRTSSKDITHKDMCLVSALERLVADVEGDIAGAEQIAALRTALEAANQSTADRSAEAAKLQAFKVFVHRRFDELGITQEPNGPHSKEGCRVGDRIDEIAAYIPRWTDHAPTREGLYWMQTTASAASPRRTVIVRVFGAIMGVMYTSWEGATYVLPDARFRRWSDRPIQEPLA